MHRHAADLGHDVGGEGRPQILDRLFVPDLRPLGLDPTIQRIGEFQAAPLRRRQRGAGGASCLHGVNPLGYLRLGLSRPFPRLGKADLGVGA